MPNLIQFESETFLLGSKLHLNCLLALYFKFYAEKVYIHWYTEMSIFSSVGRESINFINLLVFSDRCFDGRFAPKNRACAIINMFFRNLCATIHLGHLMGWCEHLDSQCDEHFIETIKADCLFQLQVLYLRTQLWVVPYFTGMVWQGACESQESGSSKGMPPWGEAMSVVPLETKKRKC